MDQENIKTPSLSPREKLREAALPNLLMDLFFFWRRLRSPDNPPGGSGCRRCSPPLPPPRPSPPPPPHSLNILLSAGPRYSCSGKWLCCWKIVQN